MHRWLGAYPTSRDLARQSLTSDRLASTSGGKADMLGGPRRANSVGPPLCQNGAPLSGPGALAADGDIVVLVLQSGSREPQS